MAVDRTNPSLLSNYFWFPCGIESRDWCDTAKKVAAIAIHIGLAYLTYGLFTAVIVGKYLFEAEGPECTALVKLPGSKSTTKVTFRSIDELRGEIKKLIGPKAEVYSVVHAGKDILVPPLRRLNGDIIHPLTVPVYTVDEFVALLSQNKYISNICRQKPVATEQTGVPVMRINWFRYSADEQQVILNRFSSYLSEKKGEKITVKAGEGANRALLFYSEEHLSQLAEVAGKTLESALEIVGTIQELGTEGMDFIYLAFGDFAGFCEIGAEVSDLTEKGREWYQRYNSK